MQQAKSTAVAAVASLRWFEYLALAAALVGILSPAFAAAAPPKPALTRYQDSQVHMGATFQVVLYAADQEAANIAATAAFQRVHEIDARLSDYNAGSELSALCEQAPTKRPITISRDLRMVLAFAQALAHRTAGAFDVTVGPYSKLWRAARQSKTLPAAQQLQQARRAVGYRNLQVNSCQSTARLLTAAMQLDLGGIAKGYAADEALRVLHKHGIKIAFVNAGGDMAFGEPPPGKPGWRIGVAPLSARGAPSRVLTLSNCGVATSGDAWQYVEIGDVRYSHIIDPRTGLGLTTPISVTVVASDGMNADALASAVSVLGPEQGIDLIEQTCRTAALIVRSRQDGSNNPETFESKRFSALTQQSEK